MKIGKILKISISAILSLALIASIIVIPAVSAETAPVEANDNLVVNGSFEDGMNKWNGFGGFASVSASAEGITAVDGSNVLKVDKSAGGSWYNRYNDIAVEANTDYTLSFWIYKTSGSYISYKIGGNNLTADDAANSGIKAEQKFDNNTTYPTGKWVKVEHHFNSGVSTSVRVVYVMYNGVVYVDNVSLTPTVNYIKNGSFENGADGWSRQNTTDFTVVKAADEGVTVVDGTNVLKGKNAPNDWSYINQSVTLKKNTKYRLTFSYQVLSGGKLFFKAGTNATQNKYVGDTTISAATNGWKTYTKEFTTLADDASYKMAFQLRSSSTATVYVDNVVLSEIRTVTVNAEAGGTAKVANTGNIYSGDNVTVTATSNAGYWFDGWYYGDKKVSDSKSFTFKVINNIALTAKFAPAKVDGIVENGSFEVNHDNGWTTNYANEFTVVNAADEAPAKAIDGEKILKVTAAGQWHSINQNVTLEKNKEYIISFWYYRHNSGYISLKFGNSTADNGVVKESWLNNETKNKWVYKRWVINTKDDTTLKMILCAFEGTAYIDDIRIVETDAIGNIIENGDMSNVGKALNAWDNYDANCFSYDAEAESYTGNGALKITGSTSASWANAKYTLNVKANTDYVFRFYAKNAVAGKKSAYKILGADNKTYMFNGTDAYTNGDGANGDGADWGKNEWRFNSGENTTLYLYFVEVDNVTYIDDIYLGEAIEATCASSNKALGTVSASKAYVGEDDEVTYTATATAGGKFLGWRVGGSDTLVEGETYTYKGFDDITITAVFEAALGNVNEDGAIDAADMAALRESILGSAEYTALGDMNANAANDIRDLVALYRAISN